MLICADEPLRSTLSALARSNGYEPREPATLRQALEAFAEDGDRIGHALISSDLPPAWSEGIDAIVRCEYPHVHCCVVTVS